MTKSKHTPAPWTVSKQGNVIARNQTPELIAKFSKSKNIDRKDQNKANTRLIAASPDMLDCIKVMVLMFKSVRNGDFSSTSVDEMISMGNATIEKAEGTHGA